MIRILLGGSPCTHWSIAQKNDRETEPGAGVGWELFKNYLIAKEKFSPDLFLYENNKSAAMPIKEQISEELGRPLQYIDSALVSAQMRQRFYCHNFGEIPQPRDRGVYLQDILDSGLAYHKKSYCLTANYYKGETFPHAMRKHNRELIAEPFLGERTSRQKIWRVERERVNIEGVPFAIDLPDGDYTIRKLTVAEAARLQTMPENYCRSISKTPAYMALGNGWTAEVIVYLLGHALEGVPRDEKLVVLSMYDGIATGRLCLGKLGFTNIEYHAYEIEKAAITVAQDNYPDIIQHGDAFAVRKDGWSI